jgi:gamma-glutamyltranspeptidase/glutathione hydrolase/leukotriene-C4 hydrolase
VKWVDPVQSQLKDNLTLYAIPPPGSGALTVYILNILKNLVPWKKEAARDPLTYHQIAEAFKYAFAHRTKLADPYNNTRIKQVRQQTHMF